MASRSTAVPKVVELCMSPDKGGLELYALRTAMRLSQSGVACFAVVARQSQIAPLLAAGGVSHRSLRVAMRWLPLLSARRLATWIDEEGVDVLHFHWAKDLNLGVLAKKLAVRPVRLIYTRQMAITRPKRDWYHRLLYRNVDLLLVITRRLREEARRFLPMAPERIEVLPLGVARPPQVEPVRCAELRKQAGIPADRFMIGLFGRIEPAKGQHVLVDALSLLRGRDVHAVLFGHPMKPQYLHALQAQITQLGLDRHVFHYGFHPQPEQIMGCFDCIVLTTYNETFGLVLVEAMRAGVAVIGTAAGGVSEIIDDGETGLLVPPRDPAALAAAIECIQRDPVLRRRLAAAGKAAADARFDEQQHYAQLMARLRRLAAT